MPAPFLIVATPYGKAYIDPLAVIAVEPDAAGGSTVHVGCVPIATLAPANVIAAKLVETQAIMQERANHGGL